MYLKDIECGGVNWIHLVQDEYSNDQSGTIRGGEFPDQLNDYQLLNISLR
jgi:hypothetical protein